MLVKFRHGVVKQRKDSAGNPSSITVDGDKFRLRASKQDPFTFTVSYLNFDYVFDIENEEITWKIEQGNWFLFLQVDFLTGKITSGKTSLPVFYTDNEPQDVSEGQHWYDVNDHTMRVFEDGVWKDTLRVFIGSSQGGKLSQARVGSQFNLERSIRPLYPVYDTFGYPMRVRRPKDTVGQMSGFMGSVTKDLSKSKTLARLGDFLVGATASTAIPQFGLVHLHSGGKVKFSDSTDPFNRVIGMVENGASPNQSVDIKTFGFVKNPQWNWSNEEISRPVFSDGAGNITTIPQDTGVHQQVGFILSSDTIFLDIKRPIILTLPRKSYSFVPGELKPSVVISYTKEKKFTGGEIEIDFETEPVKIFNGAELEIDFQTEPQKIFTPENNISFSYSTQDLKMFQPGAEILFSFGIEDLYKFSAGSGISLLDFEDYNTRTFSGDAGDIIDFNTTLANVLTPDNLQPLCSLTIFDLYSFTGGGENPKFTFEISPINVFVPQNETIFIFTTTDRNVFIGNSSSRFSFETVARNIFGTTPIEQRISFSAGSGVKVFSYGTMRQLFTFSA